MKVAITVALTVRSLWFWLATNLTFSTCSINRPQVFDWQTTNGCFYTTLCYLGSLLLSQCHTRVMAALWRGYCWCEAWHNVCHIHPESCLIDIFVLAIFRGGPLAIVVTAHANGRKERVAAHRLAHIA